MKTLKKIKYRQYVLKIYQDTDATSPLGDDDLVNLICFHNRYVLGHKHDLSADMFTDWDEMEEHLIKTQKTLAILPLYLYDHSGICISTESFVGRAHHGEWDSGQVGFAFITKAEYNKNWGNRKILKQRINLAEKIIKSHIETYNSYLTQNCYGFELKTKYFSEEGTILAEEDSCSGFYGSDLEQNGILDNVPKELREYIISNNLSIY